MKFESRILMKILVAFFLAWTLFLIFIFQSLYNNIIHDLDEHNASSAQQLVSLMQNTGNSLLTISKNMSDLVFSSENTIQTYTNTYLKEKLAQSWGVFNKQYPLLTMGYYDKNHNLIGSWGIELARNQIYATPPELLRAFEERVGINYFSCQDICYYHASRAFYPNSFEYGILHLSLPIDSIFTQFKSLNAANLTLLQNKNSNNTEAPIPFLSSAYYLQTTTRLLEFRSIRPLLSGIKEKNYPYLFWRDNRIYCLYAFSLPDSNDLVYILSNDVSERLISVKDTFIQIMLGSFLVLCLMLGVLHLSLHQLIARLNKLIKILPLIGDERFKEAADQLEKIATTTPASNSKDELGLLHTVTKSLNQQLKNLYTDYLEQNIQLRQLAEHDAMTGLYNRRKFQELIEQLHATRQPFLLVYFDLDHFKLINDALGHSVGDQLLILFADILRANGQGTLIGRIGGDEFSMIILNTSHEHAYVRLRAIAQQMDALKLKETTAAFLSCTPSIGVACYPADTEDLDQLAAFADAAMYENKRRKQGVCVFYSGREITIEEEKQFSKWINLIFYAIQHNQLMPFFQPIVDASRQEIIAFEALARLRSKQNIISPADSFINYAEKAMAIIQLDYAMLDQIFKCAHLMKPLPCLMINMSNITLGQSNTNQYIFSKLQEYAYDPTRVVFELTESHEIKDFDHFNHLMAQLRTIGIRFALDDFGMGYSSFNYINHLHFDFIKIDKSLMNGLLQVGTKTQVSSPHIIESIVSIAKQSNIITIAEGIESVELMQKAIALNIDLLQGYLFGKPAAEFPKINTVRITELC